MRPNRAGRGTRSKLAPAWAAVELLAALEPIEAAVASRGAARRHPVPLRDRAIMAARAAEQSWRQWQQDYRVGPYKERQPMAANEVDDRQRQRDGTARGVGGAAARRAAAAAARGVAARRRYGQW